MSEQPAPEPDAPQQAEGNQDELPAWARDAITKANKEAATYRAKVKELSPLAKQLEDLQAATASDTDKAIAVARAEARAEALQETGALLVDAAVTAAAAGRAVDVEALLEGLDRSRFLGDDGRPDSKAIAAWVDRIAPANAPAPGFPDLGQGPRGAAPSGSDMNTRIRQAAGRA